MSNPSPSPWPPHGTISRPWRPAGRGGTRADRELRTIDASLPPKIAEREVPVTAELAGHLEAATMMVTRLDRAHGSVLEPLGLLLLRTESVASSKIERITAGVDDYARAEHGSRANDAATEMVAGTAATASLIGAARPGGRLSLRSILQSHRTLMGDRPDERPGKLRTVQNWIGGSDHSPRDAWYVPPPPDVVPEAMDDLVRFANRDDVPALAVAAIAHAQFESIHPFLDGNGRVGRALVNAVLRRRGATPSVVVPIASALVAHRDRYFDALTAYRSGDVRTIVAAFAIAAEIAASESLVTADRLAAVPDEWRASLGRVRAGSAVAVALDRLPAHPVVTADDIERWAGVSSSNAYAAVDRLVAAGILRPLTDRKRSQVWGASAILDEVDALGHRIARAAR
jgi:Fic family protein